jgi:hypothetical protein
MIDETSTSSSSRVNYTYKSNFAHLAIGTCDIALMEILKGKNENIPPLKTFGCMCFVQDNSPNVGKLNLRVVKCIFVGYSSTQKGYVCWSPAEKRLFVSMDVIFRELESYYSSEVISPFRDSLDTGGMRRDGDSSSDDGDMYK